MEQSDFLHVLTAAWVALILAAIAAELRKVVRHRGWHRAWWWAAVVALAAVWGAFAAGLHQPLVDRWLKPWFFWLFWRKTLMAKVWLGLTAASLGGIALMLGWDWLVYRRLPWSRWRRSQGPPGERAGPADAEPARRDDGDG